ncbi:MAG: phosphotransferase [Clostridiales bacterium]
MLEKSVLVNETIISEVKNNYGIDVEKIVQLDRGSANLFKLVTDCKNYILKEFQSYYDEKSVNKEVKIINHLRNDDIKVPVYVKDLSGQFYFSFNGKTIILQEFIEGYVKETNLGTKEQILESAKFLGKIVKSLESYPKMEVDNAGNWNNVELYNKSVKKYKNIINKLGKTETDRKIRNDLKDKIYMMEKIKKIDLSDISKVSHKNSHGDYSVMQFIYKDEKINSVIDFITAKCLPIVWEVIRSYSYIDKKCIDGVFDINNLVDYVKEFNKYIKLNKYDLKYMPYIYLVQLLTSSYGYKQYINNSENSDELLKFAFTRTNIARFLYDNSNLIGKTLEEEVL